MSRQLEERQVRAVYESIDTGAYKTAVQQAQKLLKRQPGNVLYKALKCLALARSGRLDDEAEAHALLDEVVQARPTDESVLGVTSHALRALNRPFDSITLFEEAYKQLPGDEELGSQAFMAHVRVGNWKPAQVLATRMFKQFSKERMLWWAIMCAVLQSMYANTAPVKAADPTTKPDVRNLLLGLALRLIERAPESAYGMADRFALHLDILQALERAQEALDMLDTPHGQHLVQTSPVVQEIRRELILRVGAWSVEKAATAESMTNGERSWEVVLSHINSHLYAVVSPPIESIPVVDPGLPGPLPPWPAPVIPEDKREALLEAAKECKAFFDEMVKTDAAAGAGERTAWLALLELEKRVRAYDLGETPGSVVDLPALLEQYVETFGDKVVCVEDVLPHLAGHHERLYAFAQARADAWFATGVENISNAKDLQRLITSLRLARAAAPVPRTVEQEVEDARRYTRAYLAALPLGVDLPRTELQPADELALLAGQALVGAWHLSRDEAYLVTAVALLERACSASRYAYGLRLCLVRVLRLLGAGAPALAHYRLLGTKQVQNDTLSHYALSRASTFSLSADGNLEYIAEATEAGAIYLSNTSETPEMLIRAFQFEKYSQVTDFMTFQDRLDCSLQRDLTALELARMRLMHNPSGGVPEAELADMKSFFDRTWLAATDRYDNRDFGVLPNTQPIRGATFDAMTTLGPCSLGGGWANAFLKLYLRVFVADSELDRQQDPEILKKLGVELPRAEEPLSVRVRRLEPEELAELTDDERAFVTAVDEVLRTHDSTNGNGSVNGTGTGDELSERLAKGFDDAYERVARKDASPWEVLHAATLLHERFVLFSLIMKPAGKKRQDPLRVGRAALKRACTTLKERATSEDSGALVERCQDVLEELVDVEPSIAALARARREAFESLARGITRVSLS